MEKTEDTFRDLRYHQVGQYFIVGVLEGEEKQAESSFKEIMPETYL